MKEETGLQSEPTFGGRHVLILAAVFSVLFGISIGATLILGAEVDNVAQESSTSDANLQATDADLNATDNDLHATDINQIAVGPDPFVADTSHGGSDGDQDSHGAVHPNAHDKEGVDGAHDELVPGGFGLEHSRDLDDMPLLAVVIDDWGYGWEAAEDFLALPVTLNVAVIPYLPYSRYHAEQAEANGHQVILHLPMEPLDQGWDLGDGAVTTAMADDEISRDVHAAWQSIPHVSGANNHMGSKATADERVVTAVLMEVKAQDAFFLDSRTTSQSVVAEVAEKLGVRYLTNDRFIDPDPDPQRVQERLLAAARIAKSRGWAIAIGHVQRPTYAGLVAALPQLEAEGIRLASLDEVLARVEARSVP